MNTKQDTPTAQSGPSAYRKKPVVIQASQWFKHGDHPAVVLKSDPNRYSDEGIPWCPTLEGGHVVKPGDWIITGVKGEFYPCKPDIFAMTYEPATDPPAGARDAVADAAVSLRGLAGVIRKHGTCAPSALEVVAERLEALTGKADGGELKTMGMVRDRFNLPAQSAATGGVEPDLMPLRIEQLRTQLGHCEAALAKRDERIMELITPAATGAGEGIDSEIESAAVPLPRVLSDRIDALKERAEPNTAATGMGDADIAQAEDWVRSLAPRYSDADAHRHTETILEALAAYDPSQVGARTAALSAAPVAAGGLGDAVAPISKQGSGEDNQP